MSRWTVWTYDVWGNKRDGWEVNEKHRAGSIEVEDEEVTTSHGRDIVQADEDSIIKAMKRHGYLKPRVRTTSFDFNWSDENFCEVEDAKTGEPLFEIERQK